MQAKLFLEFWDSSWPIIPTPILIPFLAWLVIVSYFPSFWVNEPFFLFLLRERARERERTAVNQMDKALHSVPKLLLSPKAVLLCQFYCQINECSPSHLPGGLVFNSSINLHFTRFLEAVFWIAFFNATSSIFTFCFVSWGADDPRLSIRDAIAHPSLPLWAQQALTGLEGWVSCSPTQCRLSDVDRYA